MEPTQIEPPRFVIACGPTGARLALAEELGQHFDERLAVQEYLLWSDPHYAGVNTDYRWALKLACQQATWENKNGMPTIFTHSLLDGLAHATIAVERHAKFDNVSQYTRDKWLLTFGLIGVMFRDSFKADEVFFMDVYEGEDDERYIVQERIRMILDEFQISYHVLDVESRDKWIEQASAIIERKIGDVESGSGSEEEIPASD